MSVRESVKGEIRLLRLGLTAEKIKECRWLKPRLVDRFEYVWTPDNHVRHSRIVALREGADPRQIQQQI